MSVEKLKILVLNPLSANVEKAVKIVNVQNKKVGPFDFSLFLGDVFNDSQEKIDSLDPDIPVYYSEGEIPLTLVSEKLVSKLHYLGRIGIYKLVNGVKIGFVWGNINDLTAEHINEKFKGIDDIDILITYHWPDAIAKEERLLLVGNKKLDGLIDLVRPRYWFSAGGTVKGRFFERKPYKIDGKITRFISLATMNEGKWWYAFQLNKNPDDDNLDIEVSLPPKVITKRPLDSNDDSVISESNKRIDTVQKLPALEVTPQNCFLCLSNPQFELHMVISVADSCYLTVSKGPLTLKKPLGFSGHGMIVPVEHFPTLRDLVHQKDSSAKVENSEVFLEINKFEKSIVEMFNSIGDYSVVFWEISRKRTVHFHVQFVPVHNNKIPYFEKTLRGQIEYDKRLYTERLRYKKFVVNKDDMTELNDVINNQDYVMFTLYERMGVTKYLITLGNDDDKFFDAQFPRKVMAVLLNLKNRVRWDKCTEKHEEESLQKEKFQEAYRSFDIMLHK